MKRVVLAAAAMSLMLAGCSGDDPEDFGSETYSDLAEQVCRDSVRNQLKAPDSAAFRDLDTSWNGDLGWRVTGEYNAENSFGGKVGFKTFTCKTAYTEDDETMRGSATIEMG